MEDGFARGEEGGVAVAFVELGALLVYGEGDGGCEVGDDVEAVLEARGHVVLGGFGGHPFYVVDCVGGAEVEPVVVLLWKLVDWMWCVKVQGVSLE